MEKLNEVYISATEELIKECREEMEEVKRKLGKYVDMSSVLDSLPPPPPLSWILSQLPFRPLRDNNKGTPPPPPNDHDDHHHDDETMLDDGYDDGDDDDGYWEALSKKLEEVEKEKKKMMEELVKLSIAMATLEFSKGPNHREPWHAYLGELVSIAAESNDQMRKVGANYQRRLGVTPYSLPFVHDGRERMLQVFDKMNEQQLEKMKQGQQQLEQQQQHQN